MCSTFAASSMRPCAFRVRIAVMPAAVRLLVTARIFSSSGYEGAKSASVNRAGRETSAAVFASAIICGEVVNPRPFGGVERMCENKARTTEAGLPERHILGSTPIAHLNALQPLLLQGDVLRLVFVRVGRGRYVRCDPVSEGISKILQILAMPRVHSDVVR